MDWHQLLQGLLPNSYPMFYDQVSPKQGASRGKKSGNEGDANVEEEDVFTSELQRVKHIEPDPSQSAETTNENFVRTLLPFIVQYKFAFSKKLVAIVQ